MEGRTIRSFLILPIQRIPRYNLLLEDLIKHTPEQHVDYGLLVQASEKMKAVANDLNQVTLPSPI